MSGLVIWSVACASSGPNASSERAGAPLGTFALTGPTFGPRTLHPHGCSSGERQFFFGFDLADEKEGVVVRLAVDPASGPVVRVFQSSAPFDRTIVFHRSECRVFHFSLNATGWRINRIQQLEISLELDCLLPSGDNIVGEAQDPGCL